MHPIALLDAQYDDCTLKGRVACVVAESWVAEQPESEYVVTLSDVKPYRPGYFFERELPGLVAILKLVRQPLGAIVVDGYVELDETGHPGLGAHLYDTLGAAVPVVGIAKRPYRGSSFAEQVLRGASKRPLFVTARGMPVAIAAEHVRSMHGMHRIPTLARRVDQLARGLSTARGAG